MTMPSHGGGSREPNLAKNSVTSYPLISCNMENLSSLLCIVLVVQQETFNQVSGIRPSIPMRMRNSLSLGLVLSEPDLLYAFLKLRPRGNE